MILCVCVGLNLSFNKISEDGVVKLVDSLFVRRECELVALSVRGNCASLSPSLSPSLGAQARARLEALMCGLQSDEAGSSHWVQTDQTVRAVLRRWTASQKESGACACHCV